MKSNSDANKNILLFAIAIFVILTFGVIYLILRHSPVIAPESGFVTPTNTFCGGIAGKPCPSGYHCKLDGDYPDAGGTCIQ